MSSPQVSSRSANRIPDRIGVVIDRHFALCTALLVLIFLAYSIAFDLQKKMWVDELYTLRMAQQPSLTEIVRATLDGSDGAPPLYAMMVHAILPSIPSDALAVRLPSSLGFCGALICLLVFCRRRLPALYAFVAVALFANAALPYATEGRCYGLVFGCAAAALLCWQSAAENNHRPVSLSLLAVSLALTTALHYYSMFFLVPLLLAEFLRFRKSGKPDLPVLLAMLPVPLVLALHYPLMRADRQLLLHYWSRPSWDTFVQLIVFALMFAPLLLLAVYLVAPRRQTAPTSGLSTPEWAAMSSMFFMPFLIFFLSIFTTHVFVLRYVLWAEVGIAVLVAAWLYTASRGSSVIACGAISFLLALLFWRQLNDLIKPPALRESQGVLQALSSLPPSDEPIVVADHHVFMELAYYAPPALRSRLIFPVDRELDMRYLSQDTGALLMAALSRHSQLPIDPLCAVLVAHPHFILATIKTDYLPQYLRQSGYRVASIGAPLPDAQLYEAQRALSSRTGESPNP
jgi:hypothetical protein